MGVMIFLKTIWCPICFIISSRIVKKSPVKSWSPVVALVAPDHTWWMVLFLKIPSSCCSGCVTGDGRQHLRCWSSDLTEGTFWDWARWRLFDIYSSMVTNLKCIRQKDRWKSHPRCINQYGAQRGPLKIAIAASSSSGCRRTNDRCLTPIVIFGIFRLHFGHLEFVTCSSAPQACSSELCNLVLWSLSE
jgi:hypothetical protein